LESILLQAVVFLLSWDYCTCLNLFVLFLLWVFGFDTNLILLCNLVSFFFTVGASAESVAGSTCLLPRKRVLTHTSAASTQSI